MLSIYLCELTRLKETSIKGLTPIQSWFYILKNMRKFAGKPEDMGERYAAIAEAARLHHLPNDEKLQYLRYMITEEEKIELYDTGFEDGMEKGLEKGRTEVRIAIAQNLLTMEYPIETIAQVTGLTPEEITALQ